MLPDYNKPYWWATQNTINYLHNKYFDSNISIEQRVDEIINHLYKISEDKELCVKFRHLIEYGHVSLPSPMWSNFGSPRNNNLSISCNGTSVDDSIDGFAHVIAETMILTKASAGTSAYIGNIRPKGSPISTGGHADGPMPLVKQIDHLMTWVTQGNRRGRIALYMNIDNEHIDEFLDIGSEGNPYQNIMTGVCIPDWFMERVESRDMEWSGMKTYAKLIQSRKEKGYPYIFFSDTVNNNAPEWYRNSERTIWASNLCAEIAEAILPDESFACNLMAKNLVTRDWHPEDIDFTIVNTMDWIQQDYIDSIRSRFGFEKVYNFAVRHRALGLGVCGYHDYLQSKNIPIDSIEAYRLNNEIFRELKINTDKATRKLAELRGACEVGADYGVRNATLLAMMPTTSSGEILGGVSRSTEAKGSNYYVLDLAGGSRTYKNPYLQIALEKTGHNTRDIWMSILSKGGSVQHLSDEILSKHDKDVFKTAFEVSQLAVVKQAAQRQKYIDQSQSLNLFIHANTPTKDINTLILEAWRSGVKTLYYHRSTNAVQEMARSILECDTCAI